MIDDGEFAKRIRAARAYLGLNLEEAGKYLGLSSHQLSRRERADSNGMQMTVADRFHISAVYTDLTGWPPEFFTDDRIPPLPPRPAFGPKAKLSPLEVIDRMTEDDREDDEDIPASA